MSQRSLAVQSALALLGLLACRSAEQPVASPAAATPTTVTAPSPGPAGGTARMVARLRALVESTDPEALRYLNGARAARLRAQLGDGPPRPDQFDAYTELARELLRAGQPVEALAAIDAISAVGKAQRVPVSPEFILFLQRLQGVANLRLGEQQNCIDDHSIDSCLIPIQATGVHRHKEGGIAAARIFEALARRTPEDPGPRWLLNLAHMTLGSYPDGVAADLRIPPEVFESEAALPRFVDGAAKAGVATVSLSGGCSLEDFDQDGDLDLMTSAWGLEDPLRYFVNGGDGRFVERTREAGLDGLTGGLNLTHADYDNDGLVDVLVLRGAWLGDQGRMPNSLLKNLGQGRFEDVTEDAGVLSLHPTQTAAWGDYDNDGWLDLFIGNESGSSIHPCELYRNQGDGTFSDVASQVGLAHEGFVKAASWGDYDNDGDLDLFLSRLNQSNVLLRNDPGDGKGARRFVDVTAAAGVGEPLRSFPAWFFDYDNDGWLDLFVGSFANFTGESLTAVVSDILGQPSDGGRSVLWRNRGDGSFEDVSTAAGVSRVLLVMGANFGDLDNDGFLDMYLGTGEPNLGTLVPNVMLRNDGEGRFQDVTTAGGFGNIQKGHGIAFGDVDGDGDQDVYAVMGGAYTGDVYPNTLYMNPGTANHWLVLQLHGTSSNRLGHHARVRIDVEEPSGTNRSIHRQVGTGGSFGASSLTLHVGLGPARSVRRIEVRWPAGGSSAFADVPLDRVVRLTEDQTEFAVIR